MLEPLPSIECRNSKLIMGYGRNCDGVGRTPLLSQILICIVWADVAIIDFDIIALSRIKPGRRLDVVIVEEGMTWGWRPNATWG